MLKIICACVYASVEVTKGLFPQALAPFFIVSHLGLRRLKPSASPAQFPQKVKFKNVNGPETEGFGLSVMAECFMELNVADRRAAGPEPGTHNLNFHTPAERIVVSHRRYKKN